MSQTLLIPAERSRGQRHPVLCLLEVPQWGPRVCDGLPSSTCALFSRVSTQRLRGAVKTYYVSAWAPSGGPSRHSGGAMVSAVADGAYSHSQCVCGEIKSFTKSVLKQDRELLFTGGPKGSQQVTSAHFDPHQELEHIFYSPKPQAKQEACQNNPWYITQEPIAQE